MIVINPTTVAVFDAAELADAVSAQHIYEYIYLAQNIQLTSRIDIAPTKATLTFDGNYPEGEMHTITDINSVFDTDTLGVRATSNIQLTFRNMQMIGRNYFGIPYIASDFVDNHNVTVSYENVSYAGPQMVYHPDGQVRFTNCNIRIYLTGSSEAQEVAEANSIVLGGIIRISHESTNSTRAVFWFHGDSSTAALTVLPDADVNITSLNNYFMFNMEVLGSAIPVRYDIQSGAKFILHTHSGISYNAAHRVSTCHVGTGATFSYVQTAANGSNSSLYLNSSLTVEQNAEFYMQADYASAPSLVHFRTTGAQLNVSNPKSFVLYSRSGNVLSFEAATTTNFQLTGGQMNYWNPSTAFTANAGSLTDIPLYKWAKADWSAFSLQGTVSSTSTTVTGSSATEAELGNSFSNFHLHTAHAFSLGNLFIDANLILDDGSPITGTTEPGAILQIRYTTEQTGHVLNSAADANGNFSVEVSGQTPANIPAGTAVEIWANTPFLISHISTTAVVAGELSLESVPLRIRFGLPNLTAGTNIFLQRYFPENDEPILVLDSRALSTSWELLAAISDDPQTEDQHILQSALVFRDDTGGLTALGQTPIVVYAGEPNEGTTKQTSITWESLEGILLHVKEPIRLRTEYSTTILWSLRAEDSP